MNTSLGDMKTTICDPYLDDVLCYHEDFDGAVDGVDKVLERLRSKGVIQPSPYNTNYIEDLPSRRWGS